MFPAHIQTLIARISQYRLMFLHRKKQ